jgi:hypothetical protein
MELHTTMNEQTPYTDTKLFAEALLSGASLKALHAEFGLTAEEDLPIDPSGADLESIRGSRILPTPGVCQYLASDDDLTNETIDSMEIALERDYRIPAPFFITSMRKRSKGKLSVRYFYLDRE